jgi:hypothetical protein
MTLRKVQRWERPFRHLPRGKRQLPTWRALILDSALATANPARAALPHAIGAELYTVRAALEQDFEGALRRVAQMGYREVEFVGLFGHEPRVVRRTLRKIGRDYVLNGATP